MRIETSERHVTGIESDASTLNDGFEKALYIRRYARPRNEIAERLSPPAR